MRPPRRCKWAGAVPAASYTASSADRSSVRWTRLTGVTPPTSVGSVHRNAGNRLRARSVSIRSRSSTKWMALIGVAPGVMGWSVKVARPATATLNCCMALAPAGSVAVTVTVADPGLTGVTVSMLSANATAATPGDEETAV